jgi:hypothetical protein
MAVACPKCKKELEPEPDTLHQSGEVILRAVAYHCRKCEWKRILADFSALIRAHVEFFIMLALFGLLSSACLVRGLLALSRMR